MDKAQSPKGACCFYLSFCHWSELLPISSSKMTCDPTALTSGFQRVEKVERRGKEGRDVEDMHLWASSKCYRSPTQHVRSCCTGRNSITWPQLVSWDTAKVFLYLCMLTLNKRGVILLREREGGYWEAASNLCETDRLFEGGLLCPG